MNEIISVSAETSAQQKDTDYLQERKLNLKGVQYFDSCYIISIRVEPPIHILFREDALPHPKSNSISIQYCIMFIVLITL